MHLLFKTAAFLGIMISSVDACTGIRLRANDGSFVHGRTLEFGEKLDTAVAVVPRGYTFSSTTPAGPGLTYLAKYGAVGSIVFGQIALVDGMNEKGLAVGTFYFPGYAGYAEVTAENQSMAVSPLEFPNWILTQFASVDEVRAGLSKIVIAPTVSKDWGSAPPPFHYIVYDKAGNCLVIEPMNGKLVVFDNKLGVFTNSPAFDWHMTNLRNYTNLRSVNAPPLKVEGIELKPLGQGSGMVGMPGDFSPTARFVRAAIFSYTAIPSQNAEEGVLQAFHILNQFDIPVGVAREVVDGIVHTDYTMVTCVRDPQALKYYFKTYEDQTIRVVDLNLFDLNASEIKQISTASQQTILDISEKLCLKRS